MTVGQSDHDSEMAGGCVDLKSGRETEKTRKARKDQILNDSRRDTVALRIATELLDGGVAGGGLANAGLTTGRLLSSAPGFLGRTATSAAEAAALGAVAGFNEGNGLSTVSTRQEKVR